MVDRQDIDALLVGALYGELTPAEEARLQAHLESHPADRSALDDLKSARQAVRESRVFDLQSEPPQAVSALLLQEAHRRAPRRGAVVDGDGGTRDGWLARLMRSFLVHPAMAAAATLVLVLGVAGGLYLRKGGDELSRHHSDRATEGAAPAETAPPVAATTPADRLEGKMPQNDDGKDQTITDKSAEVAAGSAATGATAAPSDVYKVGLDDRKNLAKAESVAQVAAPKPARAPSRYDGIVMKRSEPRPKDLDRARGDDGDFGGSLGGAAGAGGASAGRDQGLAYGPASGNAPAPPPPPAQAPTPTSTPAPAVHAAKTASAPKKSMDGEDEVQAKEAKAPEDVAWAKNELDKAKVAVGNGDCTNAAKLASGIQQRAPGYYDANVATDRDMKRCISYVNDIAEKREASKKPAPAKAKAKAAAAPPPAASDEATSKATSTVK